MRPLLATNLSCTSPIPAIKHFILSSISPGCNDTVDAVHMLWRGFIVTAVGYLCLWITMLVTIGRMANADLMIDGGNFDAKKAGLV